jgi:hypothetical protein
MLALVDFLCGIALRARRNARLAPADAPSSKRRRDIETAEPRFDPEPAPSVPPAAESVRLDHPEPTPHPSADAGVTSPQVRSPGLQPNDGAHPSPDAPPR